MVPDAGKNELDELFGRLYEKIKILALRLRPRGASPTLGPTALAHEAYMKLLKDPPDFTEKSPGEVIAVFANAMRQILIDAARRKHAMKREPVNEHKKTGARVEDSLAEYLEVDALLAELDRESPRQRQIVDCLFYLGMTFGETAVALHLSPTTIEREWRKAKSYLADRMKRKGGNDDGTAGGHSFAAGR